MEKYSNGGGEELIIVKSNGNRIRFIQESNPETNLNLDDVRQIAIDNGSTIMPESLRILENTLENDNS